MNRTVLPRPVGGWWGIVEDARRSRTIARSRRASFLGRGQRVDLVDEGLAYADRLRLAGVEVDLELARGVTHDVIKMGRALKESTRALDFAAAALRHRSPT